MGTWGTAEEASAITNASLTTGDLVAANELLEIWVGVRPTDRIKEKISSQSKRNLRLLQKAEAYQAAWMKEKPALFERSDTDNVIQDTLQFSKGDVDMHLIAPAAKAAIQRISWRSSRTIDPLTPSQTALIRKKFYAESLSDPRLMDFDEEGPRFGFSEWRDL
jgi:hypothetical protein